MPVSSHALSPLFTPATSTLTTTLTTTTTTASTAATTTTQPLARHATLPASNPPDPFIPPILSSSPPPLLPPSHPHHPKSHPRKRRKGFWNRRGDHVTLDGYVVYAPGPLVYPKDLDDYPDGKDAGYRNEHGLKATWAPRPEMTPKNGYQSVSSSFPLPQLFPHPFLSAYRVGYY